MSDHVAGKGRPAPVRIPGLRETAREITGYWWMRLVAGIAWIVVSFVILQFDAASITTVGVLVGLMFTVAAVQNFALAACPGAMRWVSALFGGLFVISAVICFIDPAGHVRRRWPTSSASCS